MKAKAITLCRVSTQKQRLEGHSLEAQDVQVDKAAELYDAEIVRRWRLDTSSKAGVNLARKDLVEALEYCTKQRGIKYFILDEVDRFMRSIDEYFWFKVEFKKRGVRLIFASQPELNEDSQAAKLSEMLEVFRAESSNDDRKKKTTAKMKARVVEGYHPFNTRLGYKKSSTPGLHIPNEPTFGLLQKYLRQIAAGYVSPFYAGVIKIKDWPEATGLHQAMITLQEFEAIQVAVKGR
jgi:DNA invertase Pin-like site-specific DNA recombinase